MKKSFKAKTSPSMMRSAIKKMYKGRLPSRKMYDPFIGKVFYYNKNGRIVIVK